MRSAVFNVTCAAMVALAATGAAWSQQGSDAGLALCDPLLDPNASYREGDNTDDLQKTVRYDLETARPLVTDAEVIDAIAEERWDPATGGAMERPSACPSEPTYLIHWTRAMGVDQAGNPAPLATGYMSLRRDGTFGFTYEKRPYDGTWAVSGGKVTLQATWLNGGQPLESTVDLVKTPVEYLQSDGSVASYDEETYRIGPFRLMPIDTTVKGADQSCRCPG
jgi:hypothetical protein